jgi:multisubunit Na+/H+ antiporter MnhB subunit
MTALVLVGTPENYRPISEYFEEHSVTLGHGRNVVNVILVDFRALDTLGEITVLTVAAIGVYALLKLRRATDNVREASAGDQAHARASDDLSQEGPTGEVRSDGETLATSFILRSTTRLLLPLLLLFSLFLLVRGHNEPGGGFSAGLVAASAFVLYRFAYGVQATKRFLPVTPLILSGAGLLVAVGSGFLALLAGRPLMTGLWRRMNVPGFGDLDLGTPLLFDIGVYATVLGVTLSIILPLAEE